MSSANYRGSLFSLVLLCLSAGGASAAQQEPRAIPPRIKSLILGASQRAKQEVVLDGTRFFALSKATEVPFVLWPAGDAPPLAKEQDAVQSWLERSAAALGHAGLELRFAGSAVWQQGEVWNYSVQHAGIPLFDTTFSVHWDGAVLEGLCNNLPLPLASIEEPTAGLDEGKRWVYHAEAGPSGAQLKLAWVVEEADVTLGSWTRVMGPSGALRSIHSAPPGSVPTDASFTEYVVPLSSFPDQIDFDSQGRVWFSQPSLNAITVFDTQTLQYQRHLTGSTPDGLWVDPSDRVWTGLYASGAGLGRFDIATGSFSAFVPPYSSANMAIPYYSRTGRIFVTDHQLNRLSQFDPVTLTWITSEIMPTPNCWVVQGSEDFAGGAIYFTEFNVDKLGRKPWNAPVTDIQLPFGGGPAFDIFWRGSIYYSEWNRGRLGRYVIATGQVIEYDLPSLPFEWGGPIDVTPNGQIALGTRNVGYIAMFNPVTSQFTMHLIPTAGSGLKDGLVVDTQGNVWFTESSAGKLGKLSLP